MFKRFMLLGVAGGLAAVLAVPAAAGAKTPCKSHTASYLAQGKYVSSSTPLAPSKSWSGTLTIKLQSANHHFSQANNLKVKKTARGTDYTFTVSSAKVHFGKGVKSPATTADHVSVTGTVTEYSKGCTATTPTITIKSISVSK
jgi:hypothetical protein